MIPASESQYLHIPDCPVVDEFMKQVREGYSHIDLTAIWTVAGQPEALEPKRWVRNQIVDGSIAWKVLSKPDGSVAAIGEPAARFSLQLDDRLNQAFQGYFNDRHEGNVIGAIASEPTRFIGMFCICTCMIRSQGSPTHAFNIILGRVGYLATISDRDAFAVENLVAQVHRALRGDPFIPYPTNPQDWRPSK